MDRRQFVKVSFASLGLTCCPSFRFLKAAVSQEVLDSKMGPAIRICQKCIELLGDVEDFQALFHKREWNGKQLDEAVARVKYRRTPKSVYMIFGKPHEGREILYVEGKNNNEILVHEVGLKSLVGTISIDPNGKLALGQSHYSITEFGLERMVHGVADLWEKIALIPGVEVKYYPKASIGETACQVIETKHPRDLDSIPYAQSRLYLDAKTHLPVRVQHYKYPEGRKKAEPYLYEEYTYLEMETNVGFTDQDFDPQNPNYHF